MQQGLGHLGTQQDLVTVPEIDAGLVTVPEAGLVTVPEIDAGLIIVREEEEELISRLHDHVSQLQEVIKNKITEIDGLKLQLEGYSRQKDVKPFFDGQVTPPFILFYLFSHMLID